MICKEAELEANGHLVIPLEVMQALCCQTGDKIIFLVKNDRVQMTTRQILAEQLHGSLSSNDGRDFTSELLESRRLEASAKLEGWKS